MKAVLIGYPGSQRAANCARYLNSKYLAREIEITYLNYLGSIDGWAKYLADFLSRMEDRLIIFSLDDYLVSEIMNMEPYRAAVESVKGDVVCAKLCYCTPAEHEEYPVTTQYTIWDREYLIGLLRKVNTPWEFEIKGSKLFDKKVELFPCINYFTNSSVSGRWEGIRLDGLCDEDVQFITNNL